MSDSKKVSAGKPKIGGAIYVAPIGTTLPADAKTTLASTYKELGYVSSDGLTNSNSSSSTDVTAWGGDEVLNIQQTKTDTFKFKLIEILNKDVLKFVYGENNVEIEEATTTAPELIKISAKNDEIEARIILVDMILNGGFLKRIIIPNAKLTELGDIVYNDNDAAGYDATIKAYPDSQISYATHIEYIEKPLATTTGD